MLRKGKIIVSKVNNFNKQEYMDELSKMTPTQFCMEWDKVVKTFHLTPKEESKIFEDVYLKK